MLYLDRQIRKTDLEIEILEHKLEVSAWNINWTTSQKWIMLTIGTLTLWLLWWWWWWWLKQSKVIIANGITSLTAD